MLKRIIGPGFDIEVPIEIRRCDQRAIPVEAQGIDLKRPTDLFVEAGTESDVTEPIDIMPTPIDIAPAPADAA